MWYQAGLVSVVTDSATVTGAGTEWIKWTRPGDAFQGPDGRLYEVTNVASDTALAIHPPYEGPSAVDGEYRLIPVQGYTKRLADRAAELIGSHGDSFLEKAENLADLTDAEVARANLGLGSAAVADIVGTMSGGAIIERGSNANGEYVRFADGTQICKLTPFEYIQGQQRRDAPATAIGGISAYIDIVPYAHWPTYLVFAYGTENGATVYSFGAGSTNKARVAVIGRWK